MAEAVSVATASFLQETNNPPDIIVWDCWFCRPFSGSLVINQKSSFRKVLEEAKGPRATGPFAISDLRDHRFGICLPFWCFPRAPVTIPQKRPQNLNVLGFFVVCGGSRGTAYGQPPFGRPAAKPVDREGTVIWSQRMQTSHKTIAF